MAFLAARSVILTGATGGIGGHIARRLAAEGAHLVLSGRSHEQLEALARELRGSEVEIVAADITDATDRSNLLKRARARFGPVDILINNAGYEEIVAFERQQPAGIERLLEINVLAPMLLTRAALPEMLEHGRGHIVNMASLAGRTGMPYGAVYAGTKGALAEWSLSLDAEIAPRGVRSSVICPGFVSEAGMFARKEREAPGTLGTSSPQAVAAAVVAAIRDGKNEIVVNPKPVRVLMMLKAASPRAVAWIGRRLGLVAFLESIARRN